MKIRIQSKKAFNPHQFHGRVSDMQGFPFKKTDEGCVWFVCDTMAIVLTNGTVYIDDYTCEIHTDVQDAVSILNDYFQRAKISMNATVV